MKKLKITLIILTCSLSSWAQSIAKDFIYGEPVSYYENYQGSIEIDNKVYMYRTDRNLPITMARVDDKLNVVQKKTLSIVSRTLAHKNEVLEMKGNVYAIYNGYVRLGLEQAIAHQVDLGELELKTQKKILFEKGFFKVMEKSKNEEYVAFAGEKEVRMFDSNLKLLLKQKLHAYSKTVYIKEMKVSDEGEVFMLIGDVNNGNGDRYGWNFNYHVMKVVQGEAEISEEINPDSEPYLRDVIFDFDEDQNLKMLCYTMTSISNGTAGIFVAKIDSDDLEITESEMLDVSEYIPETSKILSITHLRPFYLDDGSYYLVGQLDWMTYSGSIQYSTIYVSKITKNDELSWLKYVKKNQVSATTGTNWAGIMAIVVNDKLHLFCNDVDKNKNIGDAVPKEVKTIETKKHLYEYVYETNGEMSKHEQLLPELSKKSVIVSCDPWNVNNGEGTIDYISLLVQKGMKYKRLYVRW